jgi:hypothetical protein
VATEQPALIHDGKGGIWPRYRTGGRINAAPWHHALSAAELVGTCRCGGYLKPGRPYAVDRILWYPATCLRCGQDVANPGPTPAPKRRRGR